jgi:hypothetical protein
MDNHKYEERFSSSCSFSHTGGSSFKYDMEKTASIRRDSLFLAVSHTAESSKSEMENHNYERIHIAFTSEMEEINCSISDRERQRDRETERSDSYV